MRPLTTALLRDRDDAPARPPAPPPASPDLPLDQARCPCCRAPLIARQGRRGPAFYCLCRSKGFQ